MSFALYEMTQYKVRGRERASEGWCPEEWYRCGTESKDEEEGEMEESVRWKRIWDSFYMPIMTTTVMAKWEETMDVLKVWNVQRSGIMNPYSFRDYMALVQSRPAASVSGRFMPQLNDLAASPLDGVDYCGSIGVRLSATCFLPDQQMLLINWLKRL